MIFTSLFVAVAALSSFVAAQNSTCCNLDPNSVPIATRQDWCRAEQNTCPQLCGGIGKLAQNGNTCDTGTLNYTCTCSDGTHPNVSDYQQSLPAQMCTQWRTNCVAASPNDLAGQTACLAVQCGNKTLDAAATSSSASPSSTGGSATTGGSSGSATAASATSASSKAAATALALAHEFGTPVLAAGIMAAFGLAL